LARFPIGSDSDFEKARLHCAKRFVSGHGFSHAATTPNLDGFLAAEVTKLDMPSARRNTKSNAFSISTKKGTARFVLEAAEDALSNQLVQRVKPRLCGPP